MNLVLEGAEETKTAFTPKPEIPGRPEPSGFVQAVCCREFQMLFVRGDSIIMIAPEENGAA